MGQATKQGTLGYFCSWLRPDAIAEGRHWIEQALALPGGAAQSRAKAVYLNSPRSVVWICFSRPTQVDSAQSRDWMRKDGRRRAFEPWAYGAG
jgi:hypothetical protein